MQKDKLETKGEKTKTYILEIATSMASVKGLGKISFGDLAKPAKLSRSGLFAHFQSKEQLELDILNFVAEMFIKTVIQPGENSLNPLERLELLKKNWPDWQKKTNLSMEGGCIFLSAIFEYDSQPGKVRDTLIEQELRLLKYIGYCFEQGQKENIFSNAYTKHQFSYEFHSAYMGYHYSKIFLKDPKAKQKFTQAIDSLIQRAF